VLAFLSLAAVVARAGLEPADRMYQIRVLTNYTTAQVDLLVDA
jgi:hypothetical protein